jgi:hypothetical protein
MCVYYQSEPQKMNKKKQKESIIVQSHYSFSSHTSRIILRHPLIKKVKDCYPVDEFKCFEKIKIETTVTKDHETDFISTIVLKSFYWYFDVQIPSPALFKSRYPKSKLYSYEL